MKKKNLALKISGLLLILGAFLYNKYTIFRFIGVFIGCLIFIIGIIKNKKKSTLKIALLIILSSVFIYGIDFLAVKYCNFIPIMSYKIKSSDKVSTYNSVIYRLYDCDGTKVFDLFYKKNYACDILLPEENINSLLSNAANNFSKYKNKFVNVNGKISKISGSDSLAMQAFELTENSINGQVSFSDDITLIIINNGILKKVEELKIYDNIQIIGRIDKLIDNGQNKEIIMQDAKIVGRTNFNDYEINVIQAKKCESDLKLISKTEDYTFYSQCLDKIYVKYDNENIYDLGYVLTDKRMTYEMLKGDKEKVENDNVELYEFDKFNIIKCKNSNNIIIGSKKTDLSTDYCNSFEKIENVDQFEGI